MSFGQMPLANGFLNPEQFDKEYFFELKVSFYPVKNLGAIGDGGMVVTDNSEMAEKAKLLREYGWAERYMSHLKNFGGSND